MGCTAMNARILPARKWAYWRAAEERKDAVASGRPPAPHMLVPGGFAEVCVNAEPKNLEQERVFMNARIGCIKYALQTGPSDITPVFSLREAHAYGMIPFTWLRKPLSLLCNRTTDMSMAQISNSFELPMALPYGKRFPAPDHDCGLKVVVGSPLKLPYIKNPSRAEVDYYHAQYCKKLQELVRNHGGGDLEVV